MAPKYRVIYFNSRGRAEAIRMTLTAAGQEFEDVRLTPEKWEELKPSTPQGQLPILEIDGVMYPQSGAAVRYVAKEYGLLGSTNTEYLEIEVLLGTMDDMIGVLIKVYFEKDEEKKKELEKDWKENKLPFFKKIFDEKLGSKDWLVGSSMTLADISLYCIFDFFILNPETKDMLDDKPALLAHRDRINKNEKIAEYLKTRPVTER